MSFDVLITFFVLVLVTYALFKELVSNEVALLSGLVILMICGVITPEQMLSGFASPSVLIIGTLFVISAGVQNTDALGKVSNFFLGKNQKGNLKELLIRMMVPVSAISAFMNNTPLVIIFIPIVRKWAQKFSLPASKFFLPLSYAAIFGGMCTLIGTATNLIVHGLLIDHDLPGLGFFELAILGIPCTIIGWIYIVFWGSKILPDSKDLLASVEENSKEYVVEMVVEPNSELIGKTIQAAGLRNLTGLYLFEIERGERSLGPVSHDEVISSEDRLFFVGMTDAIVDLQNIQGLAPAVHESFAKDIAKKSASWIEAVVSPGAPFIGQTAKEFDFRGKYGAGILAIHRNGSRVKDKVGNIKLKPGDTLLLFTEPNFIDDWKDSGVFYLISYLKDHVPQMQEKSSLALAITGFMVISAVLSEQISSIVGRSMNITHFAAIAAILMIVTKCVPRRQTRKVIDWGVLATIGAAIGLGKAVEVSGMADSIAVGVSFAGESFGPIIALMLIYLMTLIFSALISNKAAVAIIFPIALQTGIHLGLDPRPFIIAVAVAAAATLATPIGYQTNLIVQGAGGYRFADYLKVGVPLSLILFAVSCALIPIFWTF